MSRLIEERKRDLLTESKYRNHRCIKFTHRYMKAIVYNQEYVDGFIDQKLFREPETYSIDCDEFKNFVNNINTDPNNKIHINYTTNKVNYITTNIDIKKNMVTYDLSRQEIIRYD